MAKYSKKSRPIGRKKTAQPVTPRNRFRSQNSDGPKSKNAAFPADRTRGLSSEMNLSWVLEILDKSTFEQISAALRKVRYPTHPNPSTSNSDATQSAIARSVIEFLRSPEGQRQLQLKKTQAVQREAKEWVKGELGKKAMLELRDRMLVAAVSEDKLVLEHAVRTELAVRVERWLKSSAGRESIELERKRGIQENLGLTKPKKQSWLDRDLGVSGPEGE
jgi:hypothetical protein